MILLPDLPFRILDPSSLFYSVLRILLSYFSNFLFVHVFFLDSESFLANFNSNFKFSFCVSINLFFSLTNLIYSLDLFEETVIFLFLFSIEQLFFLNIFFVLSSSSGRFCIQGCIKIFINLRIYFLCSDSLFWINCQHTIDYIVYLF